MTDVAASAPESDLLASVHLDLPAVPSGHQQLALVDVDWLRLPKIALYSEYAT